MKPGWKTSEFWVTLTGQLISLLVLAGLVTPAEQDTLSKAVTHAIMAMFTILASGRIVIEYIQSRTDLKRLHRATTTLDEAGGRPPAVLPLVLLGLLFFGGTATAASPPTRPACLFGWRSAPQTDPALIQALQQIAENQREIIRLLQQQQRPASPAAPQYIVLSPPLQQIPLGAMPLQQIPLGGMPYQQIPLGGPPLQQVPLGPPPLQAIPLGGPPRQQIDQGTPPKQSVPLGTPPPLMPPPEGDGKTMWRRPR